MFDRTLKAKLEVVANQNIKERDYWMKRLVGPLEKITFPYDFDERGKKGKSSSSEPGSKKSGIIKFRLPGELYSILMRVTKGNNHTLHMVLTAALMLLVGKYRQTKDIIIGTSIYTQPTELDFINTMLALRNQLDNSMTFKQLLIQVRQTIIEAVSHQDYPLEILMRQLDLSDWEKECPLFDIVILLENIQDKRYIKGMKVNLVFRFLKTDLDIEGTIDYNSLRYQPITIERIGHHYTHLLMSALSNPDQSIFMIDMLSEEEKKQLLVDFNDTDREYPGEIPIHLLVERQAGKTPGNTAVSYEGQQLTYRQLNEQSNQLAQVLRANGVIAETIVGIFLERSLSTIVSLLAILKAGGAYLPILPGSPRDRLLYMLEQAGANLLITTTTMVKDIPFTKLQNLESHCQPSIVITKPRVHIHDFDSLPIPDRSLVRLKNYKNKIGMASMTNCMSLQVTRGCPYKCAFCHKVWSKHHVYRSAEKIYEEVEYYHKKGVKNFAFIDDCFNLSKENSSRFFQLVIKNKLDTCLFFPNGLRGDIMTRDYIDLMVEAGTRGINLSLETASPRLQKLIKKYLDIEKFKQVMDYIASQHPHVMLELAAMHGLPGETEEEALMNLDFIKSIQWIHFPYIHILKIYPNTEIEALALEHGISKADIMASKDLAFHQLPETLPFPKSFTRKYQMDFLNEYFLSKERLKKVLPVQMDILSPRALVEKYDTYLPFDIKSIADILDIAGLHGIDISGESREARENIPEIFEWEPPGPAGRDVPPTAKKLLLLDLSQHFSSYSMLYNVTEQPLGLVSLLTYLKQAFGERIHGRIYKSGIDFDSFEQLKQLVEAYQPHLVGIRTLTFYREFFHETVSLLRQWGTDAVVIAGGPYATSDYDSLLKDKNVDLAVLGEGEYTMRELLGKMLENDFKIPPVKILKTINGIAFADRSSSVAGFRQVILPDRLHSHIQQQDPTSQESITNGNNLAYVMYTSGSTGKPKGVMVEHRQVNNCISWMQNMFNLGERDMIIQRTNLTFDPSVWEIFWPLYVGAGIKVLTHFQSQDAEYLIQLLSNNKNGDFTMMYCPATLVTAMTYLLEAKPGNPQLKLPWLIIGAEPIAMSVVKRFYRYFTGKIVNTYGPTEATINNTYYSLEQGDTRPVVPIGKPVANNKIYILSKELAPLPINVPGEICIAGDSVARGYINKPELTCEKFKIINNHSPQYPITPSPHSPIYLTGDIGRWLEDGNIEILGRLDNQVKLRGYRIELGEIESILSAHPAVKDSMVVARDNQEQERRILTCKKCGITTAYPDISIGKDGFCSVCESLPQFKPHIDNYFKTLDELAAFIHTANQHKKDQYDCLLLYSGGRGSAYALYQLVDMGFKILTATYDNGYFGKTDLENIKKITSKLGVHHVVLTHKNSDAIMKESMKIASTVCRGCFHTSASLAGEYAYKHNINVVVGATLSRGQIIENKLHMFLRQGITGEKQLQDEVFKLQESAPSIDRRIFDLIDIDVINNGTVYKNIKFVDFYRFCNITNKSMIRYLDARDPYWGNRKNYAIYSTNCPIKQIGDYSHLLEKNYHYYGSATSWEKRLGHLSLENVNEDLTCRTSQKAYERFSKRIGYQPEIRQAGGEYLCAYIVSDNQLPAAELRGSLSEKLPDYMIPAYFVTLDQFPLTPDGKVDRNALPPPGIGIRENYEAPQKDVERQLALIWADVLGVESGGIGINTSYFQLGGHSLNATILLSKIHKEMDVQIPLAEIFKGPTIKHLAQYVEKEAIKDEHLTIEPVEEKEYYALSSAQQQMFILEDKGNMGTTYNLPMVMMIEGRLQERHMEDTFRALIKRHHALRTSFRMVQKQPVQIIHHQQEVEFVMNKNQQENSSSPLQVEPIIKDFIRPFDLSRAPLLRVGLIKQDEKKHILMVDMHHIVSDAVSLRILVEDFFHLYEGNRLPELPIQYKDFSEWQNQLFNSGKIKVSQQYWLKRFKQLPSVLDIPTDYPRPSIQQFEGDKIMFSINSELTGKIKRILANTNTTLYIGLLAIYFVLLHKYSEQEDITVGIPSAGRNHADIEKVIGVFINTLAIRNYPKGDKTFGQFLDEVKESALGAYQNENYPFEYLVEQLNIPRDFSRNPVLDVLFVSTTVDTPELEIEGLTFSPYQFSHRTTHLDLVLYMVEKKDTIDMLLEYSSVLFKSSSAEQMTQRYIEILRQVVENKEIKLEDIEISLQLSNAASDKNFDDYTSFDF